MDIADTKTAKIVHNPADRRTGNGSAEPDPEPKGDRRIVVRESTICEYISSISTYVDQIWVSYVERHCGVEVQSKLL